MPKYAFKFISGKYQGGEFPIPTDGELLIGRAADLDMVLVEDMVSRKHAKLVGANGTLSIVDLGSTNGTFVNGEKIKRAELKKDDRVLIGTSILKVVLAEEITTGEHTGDKDSLKAMMDDLGKRAAQPSSSMSGDLEDVPLPDLLQLFSTNKKTGVLTVGTTQRGRLYLKEGVLRSVMLQNEPKMQPLKAVCRMLLWTSGAFQFESLGQIPDMEAAFDTSTENVMIEAMRQNDEAKRLLGQLPPADSTLQLLTPITGRLAELKGPELDTLQLAINERRLGSVLDRASTSDSETLTNLQKLLKTGFLSASS